MSDKMIPIPFHRMLSMLLLEYKETKKFYGVPVYEPENEVPIGPAAGPHTQLAGNIIAAYAAGATYFELKTVQILEGEELQIKKPCIYVGHEVFNTEWSTELTVEQARDEYIKAYLLLQVLSREFSLRSVEKLTFVMSVGYDLKGIQSNKVDGFIND
ncbi:MAG TPA: putative selenate reductase subunit YgfK, partial [Lachnospiraceae bacterium]|nr:putative selenate reductase subunit YgfK [Lachnospiraceae bacterium]